MSPFRVSRPGENSNAAPADAGAATATGASFAAALAIKPPTHDELKTRAALTYSASPVCGYALTFSSWGPRVDRAWLARRIGLVNTMVFTHLPSSLFLIAAAFAPSLKLAVALFLCREALVEMDVPTRQSYVAAVVLPNERTFASGITNLARNVFWAIGSSVAGFLMQSVAFSAPLVIGGGVKVSYDLLLYRAFRKLRPPEEQ